MAYPGRHRGHVRLGRPRHVDAAARRDTDRAACRGIGELRQRDPRATTPAGRDDPRHPAEPGCWHRPRHSWLPRSAMTRRFVLSVLICALVLGSAGCSLFARGGPEDAFDAFADALQRRDNAAAGASTSDPAAAAPTITSMFDGMGKDATVAVKVMRHQATTTSPRPNSTTRGPSGPAARCATTPTRRPRSPATTGTSSGPRPCCTPSSARHDVSVQRRQELPHPGRGPGRAAAADLADHRRGQRWRGHISTRAARWRRCCNSSTPITGDSINDQFGGTQDDIVTVIKLREARSGAVARPTAADSRRHRRRAGRAADREPRPVVAGHRRPGGHVAEDDRRGRGLVGEPRRRQG